MIYAVASMYTNIIIIYVHNLFIGNDCEHRLKCVKNNFNIFQGIIWTKSLLKLITEKKWSLLI